MFKTFLFLSVILGLSGCREETGVILPPDTGEEEEAWSENHHYRLPLVFHVLYADPNNPLHNVASEHITNLVKGCNQLYDGCGVDMNLEFVLAETAPDGTQLSEPGINRVIWKTPVMDSNVFMTSDNDEYIGLLWDPDKYINVVLYQFTSSATMGVTLLPYTVAPASLEGCVQLEEAVDYTMLDHPHCISLNNTYIMDYRLDHSYFDKADYIISDPAVTLAHELGHYLGLRHVFSEDPETGSTNYFADSDFCDDTPTYNKPEYDRFYAETGYSIANFDTLVERTAPDGTKFISDNIMDYAVTYANRFTPQQRERVRYILENAIFIPGPKRNQSEAASVKSRGKKTGNIPVILVE